MDEGFLEYIENVVTITSQAKPDFILLDDDLRLDNHFPAWMTCMCPLHLELHRNLNGRSISREKLFTELKRDDKIGLIARGLWQQTELETFRILGNRIRRAIDIVDPEMRCGICVTGCPNEAVKLNLRADAEITPPPSNYKAWEQERLRNRDLLTE